MMEYQNTLKDNYFIFKRIFLILILIFSTIQLVIYPDKFLDKLIIILGINILSIIIFNFLINKEIIQKYLFQSIIVISINFFYFLNPLFFKTLMFEDIFTNLETPLETFGIAFLYQLSVFFSFLFYIKKKIKANKSSLIFRLYGFNFFNLKKTIFLSFFLICNRFYLTLFDKGILTFTTFGNIPMKFLYGLDTFFNIQIILFSYLFIVKKEITKKLFIRLNLLYIFLLILFGLTSNVRSIIFEGLSILILCWFIFNFNSIKLINKSQTIIILILATFFLNFISNLILDNRSLKYSNTPIDILKITINPDKYNEFLIFDASESSEQYTKSKLLNRFTPIKYLDKNHNESKLLTTNDIIDYKKFSFNRNLGILPQNLINIFKPNYQKILFHKANGSYIEQKINLRKTGDFNTGSFLVELLILTNSYIFTFILITLLFLILFFILGKFQIVSNNSIYLSPLLILLFPKMIYLIGADGLISILNMLIRAPIQIVFIYYLMNLVLLNNKYQNLFIRKV